MSQARFVVGIDLGTTNTAVATAQPGQRPPAIEVFHIPQLVAEGEVAEQPALPSAIYLASGHDLPQGALSLPWDGGRQFAVGSFARVQGARIPGRLVVSAKSWLCHGGVDRTASILPWGGAEDCRKISPVEASSLVLAHVRKAWDYVHPGDSLAEQEVVVTVPASFDEYARRLTVEAARESGLGKFTLIEEPQAAFYAWLWAHADCWQEVLASVDRVLVVDVGGGTTDFALVAVRRGKKGVGLERIAVGDHLLLGGDNMDISLARRVEKRLVGAERRLDSARWQALVAQCRAAKEKLLSDNTLVEAPIELAGGGRRLVGGFLTQKLTRGEVREVVIDGFFPVVSANSCPGQEGLPSSSEWGLPFASDLAVTRHLAAFLAANAEGGKGAAELPRPDALLFNGGAMMPSEVRRRVAGAVASWFGGREPVVLDSVDLNLAVARGAAAYGLARRGLGVRITGGSGRSYYLGLGRSEAAGRVKLLCLVGRGMEEGEEQRIDAPGLEVLANQPVSFPLYTSSTRGGERTGEVMDADLASVTNLPPLRTVLGFGRKAGARPVPVTLSVKLSEIGILEVWCISKVTSHRWRLEFQLRGDTGGNEAEAGRAKAELVVARENMARARAVMGEVFEEGADPVAMMRRLELALGAGKDLWPLAVIRTLWEALWEHAGARRKSAPLEARWLNLCGFLLRPGYGDEMDEWRLKRLWPLLEQGVCFSRAIQNRVEWWNLWKRVAGGLGSVQQRRLVTELLPWLAPGGGKGRKKRSRLGKVPAPQEIREMWQAAGGCERIEIAVKQRLGDRIVEALVKGKASSQQLWALSRLGARAPLYGPLNLVVSSTHVAGWVEKVLALPDWPKPELTAFALVQVSRLVGDRERDLEEDLRQRLAARLRALPKGERAGRLLTEVLPLEREEQAQLLDESLPAGLRMRGD